MNARTLVGLLAAFIVVSFGAEARADCYPGDYSCGTGCMPSGASCCASLGYDGYCDPGESCTSDGKCSPGSSGGSCPPGYPIDCGDDICCPSGTTCTATGCTSSGGGGGTCPSGYPVDCGDGCCPSGTTCVPGGCRSPGGGTSPGGPSGGSSGDAYCSDTYAQGNCSTVKSCVDAASERAWYTADGNTFQCSSAYDCNSAAWDLAEYCTDGGGGTSDDEESRSGCSVARPATPGPSGGGSTPALIAAVAGLALALRSRRA